jgi:autophagy-related protein 2
LHESIEVSFQEGRFILKDVNLNAAYLTEILSKRGESRVSVATVKRARIRILQINLTLEETTTHEKGAQGEKARSSVAWRAMKLGQGTDASGGGVRLLAHAEIEGFDIEFEPGRELLRPPPAPSPKLDTPSRSDSSSAGVIASYVEAAMSSLRLSVQVKDLRVKLCTSPSESSLCQYVDLQLARAQYHDVDDGSASPRQKSSYRTALHKAVDFSGITFRTGERPVPSEEASCDVADKEKALSSVIARTEGSGQVSLRIIEYGRAESSVSDVSEVTESSENEVPRIQQDVEISLNQRLNFSVNKESIQSILAVAESFLHRNTELSDQFNHDDLGPSDINVVGKAVVEPAANDEKEDLDAVAGILKQYAEARQAAERNEIRGGILIPSTAYCNSGDDGDGSVSFDAFFDANDHSFSLYQSKLEQSMLVSAAIANDQKDFVHTKLRFHLQQCGIKVVFPPSDKNSTDSKRWHRPDDEYLLLTLGDISATSSLSHLVADISLNIVHLELEDAFRDRLANVTEIGNVLRFDKGVGDEMDDNDGLVTEAPCISFHVLTRRSSASTADLVLEPLELTFSSNTLSNVKCLISQLDIGETSGVLSTSAAVEDKGMSSTWRFSLSCPTVSVLFPLGPSPCESVHEAKNFSALFERCGYMLPHATVSKKSLGFTLDALSVFHEAKPPAHSEESTNLISSIESGDATILSCQRLLCFASAPWMGVHGTATCTSMQRADIVASSGHAPLSIKYRRAESIGVDESTFPLVPPLSSFKARQEDEDSDNEDAFYREFGSLEQADVTNVRASDPQEAMLDETDACSSNIDIFLPEIVGDLTRDEALSLSNMLLVELSCAGKRTNREEQTKCSRRTSGSDTDSKATSISLSVDQVTLTAHQKIGENDEMPHWYSNEIMVEGLKVHAILCDLSRLISARVLTHELNIYEVHDLVLPHDVSARESVASVRERCDNVRRRTFRNDNSVATPLFYRSQLFAPMSPESPSFLLDVLRPNSDMDCGEWHSHFTVYNMTYRCDVESRWLYRLQQLLSPQDSADDASEIASAASSNDNSESEPSLFKIFFSLADCNLDYTTPKTFSTASRTLVRLGDLRLSSNLIWPLGKRQTCRISLGDLSVLLCSTRYDHNFESSLISRASTILHENDLLASKNFVSADDILRDMSLVTILTLDTMDTMLALSAPDTKVNERSTNAIVTVGIAFGMLSLYGCRDTFACFTETLGELQQFVTAVDGDDIKAMKEKSPLLIDPGVNGCDATTKVENVGTVIEASDGTSESLIATDDELGADGDAWATVETEWTNISSIAQDEEQAAGWYTSDDKNDDSKPVDDVGISAVHLDRINDTEPERAPQSILRIIPNHFPLKPISDPFSESDANIAKYAGTLIAPRPQARILVRDGKVRFRFFDGYDWPKLKKRVYNQDGDFVIEPVLRKLEAEKERLIQQELEGSKHETVEAKTTLLDDLLTEKLDTNETTFASTPLPEERGAMLEDLAEQRRLSRRMNKFLQISLSGLKVRLDAFPESDDHRLANCIDVKMADFFVAETVSSSKPIKLLGEWFNETEHPRDSNDGLIMMKMVSWHPNYRITEENEIVNDVSQVTLDVLPLRCNIDQRAIRFAIAFFTADDDIAEKTEHKWAVGLKEIPPPLFQSFKVKPCKLKVNYSPKKVNVEALREGSYVELINISPLVDMVITLQEVRMKDLVGFGPNIKELLSRWIEDVCNTQIYKFVANAKPFQPISSVSGSAANLIVVPWEAYKKGDKVGRAMRAGAASFAGSVAYETLNTSAKLTGLAAQALSSATPDRRSIESAVSSSFLPSRPNDTPRGIGDTANHALESLVAGLETANYKIVIVPYREYRRSGTTGAVKSVMRGIPVAIAAPVSAATEALSYTLLGARNQVRPDTRKEEEASERGLRHDF